VHCVWFCFVCWLHAMNLSWKCRRDWCFWDVSLSASEQRLFKCSTKTLYRLLDYFLNIYLSWKSHGLRLTIAEIRCCKVCAVFWNTLYVDLQWNNTNVRPVLHRPLICITNKTSLRVTTENNKITAVLNILLLSIIIWMSWLLASCCYRTQHRKALCKTGPVFII